jgi:hypothetical protein
MSEIRERYTEFRKEIPENVKLIAISKTKPVDDIRELYDLGHRAFGENKVQELTGKNESLPEDIEWHMVGHLQRNKVKFLAPFVSMIHSVDSLRLLNTIQKEGSKNDRVIDCLLQVHIAMEDTKFGFSQEELISMLKEQDLDRFKYLRFRGLMGMATFTEDMEKVREEFRSLRNTFEVVKNLPGVQLDDFTEISMGMSNDYKVAIEEGSTMIRIGSNIFGERNYH